MAAVTQVCRTLFFAALLWLVSVEQVACDSPSGNQDGGYRLYPGIGYYKYHAAKKPWGSAWRVCNEEGGHLVIINSQQEANVLIALIEQRSNDTWMSVGFHDHFLNGQYATIFGQPISSTGYTSWSNGEPNDAYGGESCGSIGRDAKLNDIDCSYKHVFVCEKELNREEYLKNFVTWNDPTIEMDLDVRSADQSHVTKF